MLKRLAVPVFLLALLGLATATNADYIALGSHDPDSFDLIAVMVDPAGSHLAMPGLLDLFTDDWGAPFGSGSAAAAGWSEIFNDGLFAVATGPSTSLWFSVQLQGTLGDPYSANVAMFDGDTMVGGGGAASGLDLLPWEPTRGEIESRIPAPGAVVLAMLGLPAIGWVKRRFA